MSNIVTPQFKNEINKILADLEERLIIYKKLDNLEVMMRDLVIMQIALNEKMEITLHETQQITKTFTDITNITLRQ